MAKSKITNMEVKKNNRNRIYRYICKSKTVSNPDIAYALTLSLPTVIQNTKELLELGLLEEVGELQSTGGRRAKALSAVADHKLAAGLDITQNHIGMVLTNLFGDILKYERIYYPYRKGREYFQEVNERLEEFIENSPAGREKILGLGISFPGIVNLQKKRVTSSHVLNVNAFPFAEVDDCFKLPCYFLNDANAGAYAEGIHSETSEPFFYLSLSNTVGGALYNDGHLMQGQEFRCGEVGHMTVVPDGRACYCGKSGCLDAYCSAKCLSGLTDKKLEKFFSGLKQGDRKLADAWEEYTKYLSIAVNNIHMVLDCDIVLGGYVGSCLEDYIGEIRQKVSARNTFSEDGSFVKPCKYKVGAAALGAALQVIETFIEQV